jgi:HK97 family phage portal protein
VENRAIRPPSEPNDNDPVEAAPGTVGPPTATPGDPDGVEIIAPDPDDWGPGPPRVGRPAPWSGWPAEWNTPDWYGQQLSSLADTAWECLDLNSSVLATMPPYLLGASESLPADWLNNPDPDRYASWEDFAKQLWWDYQLGEAFVLATARYANGYPARFHVVEPWMVNVELDGPYRVYTIGGAAVTGDLLHIRYRTRTACARGQGPLDAGKGRLVAAEVLSRYATNLAASGGIPPSVLEHPDELSAQQAADLQEQWIIARMSSIGLPAVLSGGVTWKPTMVSPTEMALVELAQFNEARIAVLLGVPPFLVGLPSGGDSLTYSTVTSLFDYHWRAGLRPKAQTVCSALSAWALPRGTTFEVNRDEYVRPDPYTRAQTWQILIAAGILDAQEARSIERFGAGAPIPLGAIPS